MVLLLEIRVILLFLFFEKFGQGIIIREFFFPSDCVLDVEIVNFEFNINIYYKSHMTMM
jgi:hypothetical protein